MASVPLLMVDGLFFLFPLGLQDGCSVHLWKMQKNVENTALVAKMQFVNWKNTLQWLCSFTEHTTFIEYLEPFKSKEETGENISVEESNSKYFDTLRVNGT